MQISKFVPQERVMPFSPNEAPEKSLRRLGEILVASGHLSSQDLRRALLQKYRSGAPLGEVLVESQMVSERTLANAIAEQWSLRTVNLDTQGPEIERLINMDPKACLRIGCMPWRLEHRILTLVVSDPARLEEAKEACGCSGKFVNVVVTSRTQILTTLERFFSAEFEHDACITCPDHFSARDWNTMLCAAWGTILILLSVLAILTVPKAFFWLLFGWILIVNFSTGIFRLCLVAARLWPERERADEAQNATPLASRRSLPRVTIMIGLLNEDLVLPKLLEHLAALDYPRELLEVMLLLEEGDEITPKHLATITPAREFDVVVVPKGTLKTKPRALNYGMNFARGEIIGILDAEDRPHPDQINDVVRTLHTAPPDVACVQGVLDFYNAHRNWLSRCFTIEYTIWFRVLVTMEEANGQAMSWVKQRSRWIKGYMVTWATHMRHPISLLRDLGLSGFLTFQMLLLGGVTSYLSIPLLWSLWIGVMGFDLKLHLGGTDLIWKAAFWSMIFGQIIMLAVAAAALLRRDKRSLIPWIFTLPIYWPLGAVAGFKALYEVFFAPYYWDKTKHGHQSDQTTEKLVSPKALMETENSPVSLIA